MSKDQDDPSQYDEYAVDGDDGTDADGFADDGWNEDDSSVYDEEPGTSDTQNNKGSADKKKSKKTIVVIASVVVVLLFLVVIAGGQKPPAETAPDSPPQTDLNSAGSPSQSDDQGLLGLKNTTASDVAPPVDETRSANGPGISDQPVQGLMDNPGLADSSSPQPAPSPSPTAVDSSLNPPSASLPVASEDQSRVLLNQASENDPPPALTEEKTQPLPSPEVLAVPEKVSQTESSPLAPVNPPSMASPSLQPVSDFPTVDSIKKQESDNSKVVPLPVELNNGVPAAPSEKKEAGLPEMSSGTLSSEKEEVLNPSTNPVDSSVVLKSSDEYKAMKAEIDGSTARIAELEKRLAEKEELLRQKSSSEDVNALKEKVAVLEKKLSERKVSSRKIVSKSAVDFDDKEPSSSFVSVQKKKVDRSSPRWSLRGAKTGQATLFDIRTADYKTVVVGESVLGLGKIVSITETSSGWVVRGTQGTVTE